MECIGPRHIEQIASRIAVNVAWLGDGSFDDKWVAKTVGTAKTINQSFVQPLDLLDGEKERLSHCASFRIKSACRSITRSATSSKD